jgi:mannose-6-phosphate isomerase class I
MENLFENHITNTDLDGNVWFYDQNGKPKMVVSKEQFEALCEYKKQQLTITE